MDELSYRRRMLILAICAMSMFIVGLDVTIVNVALPVIGQDLHAGIQGLQWVIDAYVLVLASLLMLSGSLGDRLGRRRIFQIGLATFTTGSLLCSLARGVGPLIAFRALQGVGGSMMNPVAMSIITNVFPAPKDRARAIGIWGLAFGLSLALGPVVGGFLVEAAGWQSVFWVNIPVGIAAIILTRCFVPESRAAQTRRMDPGGLFLAIVVLASLNFAIIEGPSYGWVSTPIVFFFLLAAVTGALFIRYEHTRPEPLVDLRYFRSAPFAGATVIAVSAFAAMGAFLFLSSLYLEDGRHLLPVFAGLWLLPMAAMTMIFSPVSGRVVGSRGPRLPLIVAGTALIAGSIVETHVYQRTAAPYVLASFLVFGIGTALVNPPITHTAVSAMPLSRAGVAAAIASTSRQVGSALGVAVVGSIADPEGPYDTWFGSRCRDAWWVVAGLGALVLICAVLSTGRWAHRTAERIKAQLQSGQDEL